MAWTALKAAVAAVIKTNGNQEITGAILQNTLESIISNLGENATFKGIATRSTVPGTPDGNLFYLAINKGIYANFNNIEITTTDGMCILQYTTAWVKTNIEIALKRDVEDNANNQKIIAGNNLFVFDGYVNYYGNYTHQSDSNNVCTDYLPLTPNKLLSCTNLQGFGTTLAHAVFYSERSEDSFISNYMSDNTSIALDNSNIPAGTKYVRLNRNKTVSESILILDGIKSLKEIQTGQSIIELDNANNQKIIAGVNLFTIPGYVNENNGSWDISSSFKHTDYLPIELFYNSIIDQLDVEGAFRQCSFFSSKSPSGLISSYIADNARTIQLNSSNIPSTAKYVIFNTISTLTPTITFGQHNYKAAIPVKTLLNSAAWKHINPTSGYTTNWGMYWDGSAFQVYDVFNANIYDVNHLAGKEAIHVRGNFYGNMPIVVFFLDQSLTAFVANGEKHGTITPSYYDFYENVPAGCNYVLIQQSRTGHDAPFMEMVEVSIDIEKKKKVILIGDSETQMAQYAEELMNEVKQVAPEFDIYNYGIGGEKTNEICSRVGAFQMFLQPENSYLSTDSQTGQKYFTLPSNTATVDIGANAIANSWNADKLLLLRQQTPILDCQLKNVFIDGIECLLTWTGSTYLLNRIIAGSATHKVFYNTQMIPISSPICSNDDIVIINIGQNGGWSDTDDLVNQYKRVVDCLGTSKYIIISTHYAQNSDPERVDYTTNRTAQENALKKAFGAKYINMRSYLCSTALYDALASGYWNNGTYPTDIAGETHPTATDTTYMMAGMYAPMWWVNPNNPADIIHISRRTYYVYYRHIFNTMKALGYFN